MDSSSGSHFNNQPSPKMMPPRQQVKSGVLHTSLSLVPPPDAFGSPNVQERGPNSDQVRESPTESASSRDTWPDPLIVSKQMEREKQKEPENNFTENSVTRHISRLDKMSLRDICSERVDIIAEKMHHLPYEFLDNLKNQLRVLIEGTSGDQIKEEYIFLQKMVMSRGDLTEKALTMAHRGQLELLVAVKTGIQAFLHPTVSLSQASLIEIFLYKRCRNIACGSQIPADDCTCEICSKRNGFCNLCMCVICTKFDFEVNTCRWIGCDACSHWTHTDCAIRNGQIGVGPVKSGGMLFRCRACMRTSELFGWVKDVFNQCAPLWDRESLIKELDCVRRIFHRSNENRGRNLYLKCEELVEKLKSGSTEAVACKAILSFFQEGEMETPKTEEGGVMAPQEAFNRIADVVHEAIKKMEMVENEKARMVKKARLALEACDEDLKDKNRELAALNLERQKKKQQVDELQSIVRLKQAEAEMFDLKASEARREAERLQRISLANAQKEDDYASRYLKQRLHEAEAEKQYLFQKIRLQEESSSRDTGPAEPSQMIMYNKIQDLLKKI
ncbi:putative chromatin regulator PHD family [Helianthus annuus]|nr:putative chromatin regulator PHD family [Helianthus annuus]KAJ0460893.1 putative chromatin regulator PHD family [Helianthus annuus]